MTERPTASFHGTVVDSVAYHAPGGKTGADDLDGHMFPVVDGAVFSKWGIWWVDSACRSQRIGLRLGLMHC